MTAATFLSLVFVQIFYVVIEFLREKCGFTSILDEEEM